MYHRFAGSRSERGNAGFAAVAVGLLVLGGAAALYLQAVDVGLNDERAAQAAELETLKLLVVREQDALESVALRELGLAIEAGLDFGRDGMANLSANLERSLAAVLAEDYPRNASEARTVSAGLVFARAVPVDAEADLPSPFGGRVSVPVPAFLAVEGLANVTAAGRGLNYSATTPFAARFPVPVLLAQSLAARVAVELAPGGRAERMAGQFAQSALSRAENGTVADGNESVGAALGTELYLQFGSSGNASLDGVLDARRTSSGTFAAPDVFGGSSERLEEFSLGGISDEIAVEAEPVRVQLVSVDFAGIATNLSWQFFDGQELGASIWGALRLGARGTLALTVRVESAAGSMLVGPLELAVNFVAHAIQVPVPAEVAVPQERVDTAFAHIATWGSLSPFSAVLKNANVPLTANGSYVENATTRAALLPFLAELLRAELPPVEDYGTFASAYSAPAASYQPGLVRLNSTESLDGARALVSLDGLAVASGTVDNGSVRVERLPQGFHVLQVTASANGTTYAGAGELRVAQSPWQLEVGLGPTLPMAFFRAALARGEATPQRAGFALLDEAGALVGMERTVDFQTVEEIVAFAETALARLTVLDVSAFADTTAKERAADAKAMLKIMIGLLPAADAAYREQTGHKLPVGGFAGSSAEVTLRADAQALVKVSISGVALATAAARPEGLVVTFLGGNSPAKAVLFRGDRLLVVLNAFAGALSLAADGVAVAKAFAANSTADLGDKVLVVAATALDFGKISLGIARGVYGLYGAKVLDAFALKTLPIATALTAATVILDLALLYHEKDGNLSAMLEELIHPAGLGGLTRLPALASGLTSIVADLLFLSGAVEAQLGPIGVAVGLFVLAGLIVANKEKVASAIWGTLPFEAVAEIRGQVGEALRLGFTGAAVANSFDEERLVQAGRAASVAAATAWPQGASLDRAEAIASAVESRRQLSASARALVEELDDFASPPYDIDEGRLTEGYRYLQTLSGAYFYRGNTLVIDAPAGTAGRALIRTEWRSLCGTLTVAELPNWSFEYNLTDTNAIPQSEFTAWSSKVTASGKAFELAFHEFDEAASRLIAQAT